MQIQHNNYNQTIPSNDPLLHHLHQLLNHLQTSEFIDPQFPHIYQNIYSQQSQQQQMQQVIWMPCQELHHKSYYSRNDFTLLQLEKMNFISTEINKALIVMKYLAPKTFYNLAQERQLSYNYNGNDIKGLYVFDVLLEKEMKKVFIDSCVPVSQVRNKELFAQNTKGCVFACLVQKLLAKICQGYGNVKKLDIAEILQLLTRYPTERIRVDELYTCFGDKQEIINEKLYMRLKQHLNQQSILAFKTHKSRKLQSFGLKSNSYYIMTGIQQPQSYSSTSYSTQKQKIVNFLQFANYQDREDQQEMRWIGKCSRYRVGGFSDNGIKMNNALRQYQNYMKFEDFTKVSKEILLLHNTNDSIVSHVACDMTQSIRNTQNSQSYKQNKNINLLQNLTTQQHKYSINKYTPTLLDQTDSINEQRINQTDILKYQKTIITCKEALRINFSKENTSPMNNKNMKVLINFRVSMQSYNSSSIQLRKLTVFFCNESDKSLLLSRNVNLKLRKFNNLMYHDLLVEFDAFTLSISLQKNKNSLLLLIFLDGLMNSKFQGQNVIKLKLTKFQVTPMYKKQTFRIDRIIGEQQKVFQKQTNRQFPQKNITQTLFTIFKSLLTQTNPTSNLFTSTIPFPTKDELISISCKQFINILSMGVIYIKLTNFQSIMKTESLVVHENLYCSIKIEIDTRSLEEKGILMVFMYGNMEKQEVKKDGKVLFKVLMNGQYPEVMIGFRILLLGKGKAVRDGDQCKVEFPPVGAVKISKVIETSV